MGETIEMVSKTNHLTGVMLPTIRDLVRYANSENIARNDIVAILKEGGEFALIYYK